ncbi:MAG: hypothetical protein LBT55_04765 [Clostridiaceae bacterium]|jgi:hypothetical protein|nr:hypothetical protein [Clostridiaceae bacterium]
MVSLSTFIGQLIADIANARTNADYSAASVSEQYHADPFVKTLPIPHYIIDEAEIEVPVMVVGISKQSEQFVKQKEQLSVVIKERLPILLLRGYKFNYIREREEVQRQEDDKRRSEDAIRAEAGKDAPGRQKKRIDISKYEFSNTLLDEFAESARKITDKMVEHTGQYIEGYNYEILKLLDMAEDFSKQLIREMRTDIRSYAEEMKPYYSEESIKRSADYMGNLMFFEFKKIMKSAAGVNVDIKTVQMNEYATKDCLMHIKLKIKEQDLNLVVEDGGDGKEKRYLSLT